MTNRLLVELDAIIDTRLSVLALNDPALATRVVTNQRYYSRTQDEFTWADGPDLATFSQWYAQRDIRCLPGAIMTHVPFMMVSLMNALTLQNQKLGHEVSLQIELNTHPYQLTEDQQTQYCEAVRQWCQTSEPVQAISQPPEKLTPNLLRKHYGAMIVYNFNDWVIHHQSLFGLERIPSFKAIVPMLYREATPDPSLLAKTGFRVGSDFELVERMFGMVLGLEFAPVRAFSILQIDTLSDVPLAPVDDDITPSP